MKYKITFWISIVVLILSVVVMVFSLGFFDSLIQSEVKTQGTYTENNFNTWGMFPGDTGVVIHRDHYFYNFSNADDYFRNKARPSVVEDGPFTVYENVQFLNHSISNATDSVSFKKFTFFNATDDLVKSQKSKNITTFNLVALGVWYQLKNTKRSQAALGALYSIVKGFQTDFYYGVCQQLAQTTIPSYVIFKKYVIDIPYLPEQTYLGLYNDSNYGFSQKNGLFYKALLNSRSDDWKFFKNYFNLTFFDLTIITAEFVQIIKDSNQSALSQLNITGDFEPINLGAYQWMDFRVAKDSILTLNSTVPGYVEFGAYLKKFKNTSTTLNISQIKNLLQFNEYNPIKTFVSDNRLSYLIKNKNLDKFHFNKHFETIYVDDSLSLLNKYNMDRIFDSSNPVEFINNSLKINNIIESKNIFDYLNYLVDNVAFQTQLNGTKALTGLSQLMSQVFYHFIDTMSTSLFNKILSINVFEAAFNNKNCSDVLNNWFPSISFNQICNNSLLNTSNLNNIYTWIDGIFNSNVNLQTLTNLTDIQMTVLRDPTSNFLVLINSQIEQIKIKYNLSGNNHALNLFPLGFLQWLSGNVTKQLQPDSYKKNSTLELIPNLFNVNPEYYLFCQQYNYTNNLTIDLLLNYSNFDGLYSSYFLQTKVFIPYFQKKPILDFSNIPFVSYLRFLFTESVLGGLFISKTPYDLMWGYKDSFIEFLKNQNPYTGGDPTQDSNFNLMHNMSTVPDDGNIWNMSLGINDTEKTRSLISIMGYNQNKIILREPYFNGKNITYAFRNPWRTYAPLNGTDAMSFYPKIKKNSKVWGFLDDLSRNGGFHFYNDQNYHGLCLYRFLLDDQTTFNSTLNPNNDIFYSDKYNGFLNVSSVVNAPFFAHKPYYYQCNNTEENMTAVIKMISSNNSKTSIEYDDIRLFNESFLDIEPFSGACVRASQKLTISAFIEKDELFENIPRFVPIYNLIRSANLTKENVDHVFGDLKKALFIKQIISIVSITLTTLFLALVIYSAIKWSNQDSNKKSFYMKVSD